MSLFAELKRRNVINVAMFYLVGSWLLLQVGDVLFDTLGLPDWSMKLVLGLLALGFVPVLVFSWIYEMTPEGLKKESHIDGSQSITAHTGRRLNLAIVVLLLLAVGLLVYQQYAAGPATGRARETASTEVIDLDRSIAVLPFVNMSSDPEQEYFSDGITEEILNTLVRVPGLLVTARTSTFSYKGRQADVRSIGKELGVGHILEGSVRKAGQQLRITAQLIRVSDGFHLWSQTYDRKLENIFAIQEQIATAIAEALKTPLGLGAGKLIHSRMQNMAAYEKYLQARRLLRQRGESLETATHLLEDIVKAEPGYAPGWALLSIVRDTLPYYSTTLNDKPLDGFENLTLTESAARRAIALDPQLAVAHHALANALRQRRKWLDADTEYQRAYALDDRSVDIIEDYRQFLGEVGRLREATMLARRGYELEPGSALAAATLCSTLYSENRLSDARHYCTLAIRIRPNFVWSINLLTQIEILERKFDAAFRWQAACKLCVAGGNETLLSVLNALRNGTRPVRLDDRDIPYFMNGLRYWLGGRQLVTDNLEFVMAQEHEPMLIGLFYMAVPFMDPIRRSVRFKQLVIDAGLPAYWRQRGWADMCHPLGEDDFECGAYHP